jgi:hypothetical protein
MASRGCGIVLAVILAVDAAAVGTLMWFLKYNSEMKHEHLMREAEDPCSIESNTQVASDLREECLAAVNVAVEKINVRSQYRQAKDFIEVQLPGLVSEEFRQRVLWGEAHAILQDAVRNIELYKAKPFDDSAVHIDFNSIARIPQGGKTDRYMSSFTVTITGAAGTEDRVYSYDYMTRKITSNEGHGAMFAFCPEGEQNRCSWSDHISTAVISTVHAALQNLGSERVDNLKAVIREAAYRNADQIPGQDSGRLVSLQEVVDAFPEVQLGYD